MCQASPYGAGLLGSLGRSKPNDLLVAYIGTHYNQLRVEIVVNFRTRVLNGKGIYVGNYIVKGILLPPRGDYKLQANICLRIFINSKIDFKISYILFFYVLSYMLLQEFSPTDPQNFVIHLLPLVLFLSIFYFYIDDDSSSL